MEQDLRKMMKEHTGNTPKLVEGHEERFAKKLETAFSEERAGNKNNNRFQWMKIAAVAIVFIAVSIFGYQSFIKEEPTDGFTTTETPIDSGNEVPVINANQMTIGDLSPALKKVEDFYMTGINVQLASLEFTPENKDVIDGYMEQLSELDKEYALLNEELNKMGPTEATITALIDNLKLRLDLLFKLKNKLKELKNQNNEQFNSIQA